MVPRVFKGWAPAEALNVALSTAPKLIEKATSSGALGAPAALRSIVEGATAVAPKAADRLLPKSNSSLLQDSFENLGHWLHSTSQEAFGSGVQSHVDAANDVFSALGLQVRIIKPRTRDGQVHVRVSAPLTASGRSGKDAAASQLASSQKMTPREFIVLLREARQAGNMDGLETYVDHMIADGRLANIPYLPALLERKLYIDIARLIVFSFQRSLLQLNEASLWGHKLMVTSVPVFEGLMGARDHPARRRRKNAMSEKQLRVIVDEMFENRAVHMPFVPRAAQKGLYVNCIMVVSQIVDDLLAGEGEEIICMGHRIRFHLEPQGSEMKRLVDNLPMRGRLCTINEEVLDELVDELLADASTNIVWIPDVFESQLYKGALRLLLRVAEHAISRLRLNVLGREVHMSILSSIEASQAKKLRSKDYEHKMREAMVYTEEDNPLRTVSTTELQERLKDLTEQRRILRALKDLGNASFDLTADTPMQTEKQVEEAGTVTDTQGAVDGVGLFDGGLASRANGSEAGDEAREKVHEFQRLRHTLKLARSLSVKCEVRADIEVPYSVIADVTTYPTWMPWCTSGHVPASQLAVTPISLPSAPGFDASAAGEENVFGADVGFGFETGTFLGTVQDIVKYTISVRPPPKAMVGNLPLVGHEAAAAAPSVTAAADPTIATSQPPQGRVVADAVNGFTYGERLIYDWRFRYISPKKTEVELDMIFQARSVLYMPIWDSMQHMVINKMIAAFVSHAEQLQRNSDAATLEGVASPR